MSSTWLLQVLESKYNASNPSLHYFLFPEIFSVFMPIFCKKKYSKSIPFVDNNCILCKKGLRAIVEKSNVRANSSFLRRIPRLHKKSPLTKRNLFTKDSVEPLNKSRQLNFPDNALWRILPVQCLGSGLWKRGELPAKGWTMIKREATTWGVSSGGNGGAKCFCPLQSEVITSQKRTIKKPQKIFYMMVSHHAIFSLSAIPLFPPFWIWMKSRLLLACFVRSRLDWVHELVPMIKNSAQRLS